MAKNRYVGEYPVIGIRPIVDGRRGPMMLRESLEPQVWAMAKAAEVMTEIITAFFVKPTLFLQAQRISHPRKTSSSEGDRNNENGTEEIFFCACVF